MSTFCSNNLINNHNKTNIYTYIYHETRRRSRKSCRRIFVQSTRKSGISSETQDAKSKVMANVFASTLRLTTPLTVYTPLRTTVIRIEYITKMSIYSSTPRRYNKTLTIFLPCTSTTEMKFSYTSTISRNSCLNVFRTYLTHTLEIYMRTSLRFIIMLLLSLQLGFCSGDQGNHFNIRCNIDYNLHLPVSYIIGYYPRSYFRMDTLSVWPASSDSRGICS